jgi:Homocysteine S-methyltransferase
MRAAEIARDAVGEEVLVAGSMGPTGQLAEPLGLLTRDACVDAFREQARALVEGGVDLLVLETFFALDEALWAAEAIRVVTDLPLVMSFSFDQGTKTMMGLSPAAVTAAAGSWASPLWARTAGSRRARRSGGQDRGGMLWVHTSTPGRVGPRPRPGRVAEPGRLLERCSLGQADGRLRIVRRQVDGRVLVRVGQDGLHRCD